MACMLLPPNTNLSLLFIRKKEISDNVTDLKVKMKNNKKQRVYEVTKS